MRNLISRWLIVWAVGWSLSCASSAEANEEQAVAIGSRVEMFVDRWLIDASRSKGVTHQLHPPVRREIVLTTDKPWEGSASAYFTVFKDGSRYRMYYRGSLPGEDHSENQVTCYAESTDGIHFTRPNLGLHESQGSTANNIILRGVNSHNFAPFRDENPDAKPDERYKALAGLGGQLYAFVSSDAIHWKKLLDAPVLTEGTFDSQNVAFWDQSQQTYLAYSRYFTGGGYSGARAIQSNRSADFRKWTEPTPNVYAREAPIEHFYTNATIPCPGASHHLLAFPMRFAPDRTKLEKADEAGVSDAVFMTSRDGEHWDRSFLEGWLRPGLDTRNWSHRNNMPAWGIVETGENEFSMYASEHYMWPDNRLRRLTIRRHGFASMHAGAAEGEFTTRLLRFSGRQLRMNYSTSAVGSIRVEIQSARGEPVPGYSLEDAEPAFGDELEGAAQWKKGNDLSEVAGKPVRFRFVLRDADLFAIQTK